MYNHSIVFALFFGIISKVDNDCLMPGKASGAQFFPQLTQRFPDMYEISYRCKLGTRLFTTSKKIKDNVKTVNKNGLKRYRDVVCIDIYRSIVFLYFFTLDAPYKIEICSLFL